MRRSSIRNDDIARIMRAVAGIAVKTVVKTVVKLVKKYKCMRPEATRVGGIQPHTLVA
jgi:hypothetical protein